MKVKHLGKYLVNLCDYFLLLQIELKENSQA